MLGNCIYDNHPVTNLMCEDARCKAPKVQNGKLVAEGFLNTCKYDYKENYMEHGSKVFIKCNDEYELFNETSGLLLKSNIISIACELTKILPDIIPRCIIHMQTPKKESSDAFLPNSNQTAEKDQQCHGRVLLTKNCRPLPLVLLYQAMAEIKPMRTRKTVANGTRVRLTCAQRNYEYPNLYTDEETDDSNEQVADIECVDGDFAKHNLTCKTESEEESKSAPIKSTNIDNGDITDRAMSAKCKEGYKLWFENEIDESLYTETSCMCNQTTGRIQCFGTNVECKPIGCKIPTYLEQGLTLYDLFQRTLTSGANRYEIQHNES
ncbi:uncharacterized protein LOC127871173 [Dreissena polymorpha]|uniref:uncharacterized protein LOC127871173 n=1 Tax=Dreissena polymorpha TaxID=45954 RepID=UPI002264458B|nr:uncharacterized protein LOC127871173 [Dreissena polymorpha]